MLGDLSQIQVDDLNKSKDYSSLLPFVDVNFNLEDYTYFQKEEDFDSIVDYITESKKVNIDQILRDPSVKPKIDEYIKQTGLTLSEVKELLLQIIAQTILERYL